MRTKLSTVICALVVAGATAAAASAGEITGKGQLKPVNGNSPCAFSGQEDLQWYTTNDDTTLRTDPTKGDPSNSQNWGHTKSALGLTGGANSVPAADWGCNAHEFGLKN
jgi:hypothetical protein